MTDIKKVLAYSTVSQLGYMMLALGVGGWVAGLFHLLTHAFFKALLFLGSGSVICGCHHEQEMTKMGGLRHKTPITAVTMLLGVFAIAGVPFFSGWYSKDAILASSFGYVWLHPEHALLFLLPLVTAGLTSFYMFRLWFLTFAGQPRDHHVYEHARESPPTMTVPLILLAACSVAVAWGWPVWDPQQSWLEHQIHHALPNSVIADFGNVIEEEEVWDGAEAAVKPLERNERHHAHIFHEQVGLLVLGLAVLGFIFAALAYWRRVLDTQESKEQFPATYRFLRHKWYFDEVYSVLFVRPALVVAQWCRLFDLAVIDGLIHGLARGTVRVSDASGAVDRNVVDGMVNLVGDVTYGVGGWLRNVQTGSLRNYVLFLVLASAGVFALLSYFVALAFAG
jgi:NADH-quinone oxidoreductase subunit L